MRLKEFLSQVSEAQTMPAMRVPGIVVTMGQVYRDKLAKAIRELGYEVEHQEYSGGSTQWTVWVPIKKSFKIDKFEEQLRDKLETDGYLEIEFEDLSDF